MGKLDIYETVTEYVERYYRDVERNTEINGISFSYYKSLRGYFKHSSLLTSLKESEFGLVDYKVWERVLTNIKSTKLPSLSGGLFFRYADYSDLCSRRAWYDSKSKFVRLNLLIDTPYKDFYILNPVYIIKLYNPKKTYKDE
jgi:hypothetical protein